MYVILDDMRIILSVNFSNQLTLKYSVFKRKAWYFSVLHLQLSITFFHKVLSFYEMRKV